MPEGQLFGFPRPAADSEPVVGVISLKEWNKEDIPELVENYSNAVTVGEEPPESTVLVNNIKRVEHIENNTQVSRYNSIDAVKNKFIFVNGTNFHFAVALHQMLHAADDTILGMTLEST